MASSGIISGLGGGLKSLFKNADRVLKTKTDKPTADRIANQYPLRDKPEKRVLWLLDRFYREGSFEKIQFARKWMRNTLIYQGYHELEWSEINVAWDIMTQDSGDYAFPNNYYRTLILQGVKSYVQQESLIEPVPLNDDADAQGAARAARTALEIIKKSVQYDALRVKEAIYLRLYGNSFRYAYYSKDPRYGYISANVYQDSDVVLSHGGSMCPSCGQMEGSLPKCPYCGLPTQSTPPIVAKMPKVAGTVKYPKGETMTEIVNPLEMYIRSSSYDMWHAPFVIRNRTVDRMALQSSYPDILLSPTGDEGGGEAYSTGGDLGLIYLQSLADLPGDPTQFAAWYERATAASKALLIEGWIRPSQYFFDKELMEMYPEGLYGVSTGLGAGTGTLLEARNDTIEDHWTHYKYIDVPGRIWGDGDDDLIPPQLKLDETDRLIQRNQGYNAVPLIGIDPQRINKNDMISDPSTIVEVKSAGRPIKEAWDTIQAQPLPNETWQWRSTHIIDMQTHSRQSPAAMGMHEKGVNTFGGQESAAAKSDSAQLPHLMMWKESDEMWARQMLKLAKDNWLDDRINAVEGIDGQWDFQKLKGSDLNLDSFKLMTRVMPIDPAQQDALAKATTSGLLNPQDPRVQRKAMQLYHLPNELDEFYEDAKEQWIEIEKMQQSGQQIQPMLIRDNDSVHIQICRKAMNSDKYRDNPQMQQLLQQHAQLHIMNMAKSQMMQAAIAGAAQQVPGAAPPQGQPGQPQQPEPQPHGGQVPASPAKRQQRAEKGAIAKPHRPQPSSGNQWHRQRLT